MPSCHLTIYHFFFARLIIFSTVGNPQAVGQQPLSFGRQVLSLMCCPALLELPGTAELFAPDAIARAKEYLAAIPNGIGAYSESQGFPSEQAHAPWPYLFALSHHACHHD